MTAGRLKFVTPSVKETVMQEMTCRQRIRATKRVHGGERAGGASGRHDWHASETQAGTGVARGWHKGGNRVVRGRHSGVLTRLCLQIITNMLQGGMMVVRGWYEGGTGSLWPDLVLVVFYLARDRDGGSNLHPEDRAYSDCPHINK